MSQLRHRLALKSVETNPAITVFVDQGYLWEESESEKEVWSTAQLLWCFRYTQLPNVTIKLQEL